MCDSDLGRSAVAAEQIDLGFSGIGMPSIAGIGTVLINWHKNGF